MKGGRDDRGGGDESEMDDKVVSTVNAIIY